MPGLTMPPQHTAREEAARTFCRVCGAECMACRKRRRARDLWSAVFAVGLALGVGVGSAGVWMAWDNHRALQVQTRMLEWVLRTYDLGVIPTGAQPAHHRHRP